MLFLFMYIFGRFKWRCRGHVATLSILTSFIKNLFQLSSPCHLAFIVTLPCYFNKPQPLMKGVKCNTLTFCKS